MTRPEESPRHAPIPLTQEVERDTRIPPWAVTVVAVATATAALIGWGEVRFVRRDVYDLAQAQMVAEHHRFEERIARHEGDQADSNKDTRVLSDRLIRVEGKVDAIAERLGIRK